MREIKWENRALAELGSVSRGKSKHRPRNDKKLYGGDYPFIQTADVKNANFYISEFSQTYNEVGLKQSKLWEKDTLCITIAANIAETALLSFPACFPDSIVGFIPFENISDVRYIKYTLDNYKAEFQKRSKGATQDNLSVSKINSLKLLIPDYDYQVEVADIISKYDLLIENNQRRIVLLEEMAQRLYTEWIVNFKFPGHEKVKMVESEFGILPENWSFIPLSGKIIIKKGKNITKNTVKRGNVPVVAGGIEPAYYHDTPNTKAPTITISASGANAGYVNIYFEDIWASDCSYIDRSSTDYIFFYYLTLSKNRKEITNLQQGSAQPHVYPKDLMNLKHIAPTENILIEFSKIVESYFLEIMTLKSMIGNLLNTRNLLIDTLVTGKRHLIDNHYYDN